MGDVMMQFNVSKFKNKLEKANLSCVEISRKIGRSDSFLYQPMKRGKINRSDFYKMDHIITSLIEVNSKEPQQLELSIDIPVVSEEKTNTEIAIEKMTADIKLVHELGYEKICRLYELANYEKKYGFIKEDTQ